MLLVPWGSRDGRPWEAEWPGSANLDATVGASVKEKLSLERAKDVARLRHPAFGEWRT